jgi:segregation and condensation protein A
MLAYARYRGASGWLRERFEASHELLFRSAPLPPELRRIRVEQADAVYDPARLGEALGGLLRMPAPIDLRHMRNPAVTVGERLQVLRGLLRRGTFSFDEAVEGCDRMTVAVTLYALLELYKRGEAAWEQEEPFGPIRVAAGEQPAAAGVTAA